MGRLVIPASFFAALGQMGDRRFRWVLVQGVGLTVLLLLGLYALVFFGVQWLLPDSISLPWIGPPLGWLTMLTGLGLVVDFAMQSWGGPRGRQPAY